MAQSWWKIFSLALVAAAVGVLLFQTFDPQEPMNLWGVVSFASLGACLGCLLGDTPGRDSR